VSEDHGLPIPIQKQLLQDILLNGGLKFCKVSKLCDQKPDIYGEPGSSRRRQIQNKATKWRALDTIEFSKLCDSFGTTGPALQRQRSETESDSGISDSSQVSSSSSSQSPSPARATRRDSLKPSSFNYSSTPSKSSASKLPRTPYRSNARKPQVISTMAERMRARVDAGDCYEIDVDTDNPCKNREVKVYKFYDVLRNGVLYKGYEISYIADIRDVANKDEQLIAAALFDDTSIMVQLPSEDYDFIHSKKEFEAEMSKRGLADASVLHGQHVHRTRISDGGIEEKTKILHLLFPSGETLVSKVFSPNAEDDYVLHGKVHNIETKFEFKKRIYSTLKMRVVWRVSIVESKPKAVESKKSTNQLYDEVLEGMEDL